jgi:predicted SAM-dependent methyltransferase
MKSLIKGIVKSIIHLIKYEKSKRYISRLLKDKEKIFIEIGAGDKKGINGWTTMDMTKNCDIFWDLRKGIPFPNGSISKIYSSHFFEHLTFKEGQKFLSECLRVLVPGGDFLDLRAQREDILYIEAYVTKSNLDTNRFFGYKPAYNNTTKIDYVNYTAYMDGHHKYMFDEDNIIHVLKSAGYKNACLRKFDPNLDLKERDFESIYAEAEK